MYFDYSRATYSSSGVNCTASPVNSGGKLAKSRSESKRGLNGGVTCLYANYGMNVCWRF